MGPARSVAGATAWVLAALVFLLAASFAAFFGWNTRHVDAKAYWDAGTRLRTGCPALRDGPGAGARQGVPLSARLRRRRSRR